MQFAALDWIIAVYVLSAAIQGYRRGLVSELVSITAWLLSYFGARTYALDIAQVLPITSAGDSTTLRYLAGFATAFVLILLILTVLSKMLKQTIRSLGLASVDTLLGFVVGGLKAVLWLLVLTIVFMWTPFKESDWWLNSAFAPYLVQALFWLKPILPEFLADKITV